jgi:protein-S-isoprenylcysteine O-methyltransferase Ste14
MIVCCKVALCLGLNNRICFQNERLINDREMRKVEYILLIAAWCAWCTVHSAMIALPVTNFLKDRLGEKYRFYRLFYNFIALATLIPVIQYSAGMTGQVIFRWDGFLQAVRWILAVSVLFLFISGAAKYDMLHFLGIRQIISGKTMAALSESGDLLTSGVLGITRHPWYLATIIYFWISSQEIFVSTLITNIILSVYVVIGTVLEERKLIKVYGDNYRAYQETVSMLFPVKWLRSRLPGG